MRVLAVIAVAGCFSKPPRPDGVTVDAGDDAPAAPACTDPPVEDDFNDITQPACGVGFPGAANGATLARSGGVLAMTLASGVAASDASCSWPSTFDQGAFVEVRTTAGPGGTFTILQANTTANDTVALSVIDDTEASFELSDSLASPKLRAQLPYDPIAMRWWRLRPDAGVIVGEYSADGRVWQTLGTTVTPPPATAMSVHLNAGNFQAIATAGRAEFDNLNVCPP